MNRTRIFLLAVCLIAATAFAGPETGVRGGNRDRAPVLSARDFDLRKFEGKVVLIGFWRGFDCVTCPDYIDWLRSMQTRFGGEGLLVVAVNEDRESAAATDLLNKIHRSSLVVIDPKGTLGAQHELEAVPSTFLYDRNLNLAASFAGYVHRETGAEEEAIAELVAKPYEE